MRPPLCFLIVLVAGHLAGCSRGAEYPDSWPPLKVAESSDCPDISGLYRNGPTNFTFYTSGSSNLFDDLRNEGYLGTHTCSDCTVRLSWLDTAYSTLSVELDGANKGTAVLKRSVGDFACADGALTVKISRGVEGGLAGTYEVGHSYFRLAQDGSLIEEQNYKQVSHILIVPGYYPTRSYTRWLKLAEDLSSK